MGLFDKVTGKERRMRLVGRKRLLELKRQQLESRQMMIFRHNRDRAELQKPIVELREKHREQRQDLAKRILELRSQNREQSRGSLSHTFERSNLDQQHPRSWQERVGDVEAPNRDRKQRDEGERSRKRGRSLGR